MGIADNYRRLRDAVPQHVNIVVAAKQRTPVEVQEVIEAGAQHIGENYVQEAQALFLALGEAAQRVTWHMIGHLQKNKINKALPIIDVVQTVDSLEAAVMIDKRVQGAGKSRIPILLEMNVGNEESKSGIRPEQHEQFEDFMLELIDAIGDLRHVSVQGLMTMGPFSGEAEDLRPHFRSVRKVYETVATARPNGSMQYLSMGMSNSYLVAIEEGANMIRLGTAIFGPRSSG